MGIRRTKGLAVRLARDPSGNILPMAAASVIVMAALVGGGVDMSRAYKVQNRLQNACDAGALAGRRAVTTSGFDSTAQAQATRYFNVNFDQGQQGTTGTSVQFVGDTQGNSITGQASTQMPMLMMQMFGQGAMNLAVNCSSTMGVGNSDITMVLDVTGSMGTSLGSGTRLSALQAAMKNFYSTVATATQGTNARVRYSFVPFSTTVNVGRLLTNLDPSYIVDRWTVQSRLPAYNTVTKQTFQGWGYAVNASADQYPSSPISGSAKYNNNPYSTIFACQTAQPADSAWTSNGSSSSSVSSVTNGAGVQVSATRTDQPQIKSIFFCQRSSGAYYINYYYSYRTHSTWTYGTSDPVTATNTTPTFHHFEYRPVIYDTSQFKQFLAVSAPTGSNGSNVSSTWEGCIEERQTVSADTITYDTLSGINPSDAKDLDIDTAPDGSNAMKWAPLWRKVAYYRNSLGVTTSGSGSQASSNCVPQAQALQTMTQTAFNSYANSLTAQGNTYLDIGMLWGARLANPDGIFSALVNDSPMNGGNVNRHVIFMTDGFQEASNTTYQSYGIEYFDRRVTDDGGTTQENARHSLRFRAVCDAIKAKGIRIWVIGFTSGLTADLAFCASPNSSYTANDAASLNAAFQEIAKQVGELRVLS